MRHARMLGKTAIKWHYYTL